jgi:hypothetical protein
MMRHWLSHTFRTLAALLVIPGLLLASMEVTVAKEITVPAGTRVPISIYNSVSSDNLRTSDMISATIRQDVLSNGVLIFKHGDNATLNVEKARSSGGHGRAGLLSINGGRVWDTNGQEHPINLSVQAKGHSKRGGAIIATVLGVLFVFFIPFGIWIDGTPATLQGGAVYDGITTAPITLTVPDTGS